MSKNVGSIRRSQIISTFGPGAIVDFRLPGSGALLSGVMQGLEAWEAYTKGGYKQDVVREPRLEALLGVDHFRAPPVGTYLKDGQIKDRVLPIERFPDWLSCPKCHVINRSGQWSPSRNGDSLHCGQCRGKPAVVPVRFVTICENGHLDDFPWTSWLTHEAGCSRSVLALKTVGAGCQRVWTPPAEQEFSEGGSRRSGRVPTCIRPHVAAVYAAGPHGYFAGRVQIGGSCSRALR